MCEVLWDKLEFTYMFHMRFWINRREQKSDKKKKNLDNRTEKLIKYVFKIL